MGTSAGVLLNQGRGWLTEAWDAKHGPGCWQESVVERGPFRVLRWGPKKKGSRRGTGPQEEGTAEASGDHEGLGCTQPC